MDLQQLVDQPPIYEVFRTHLTITDLLMLRCVLRHVEPLNKQQVVEFIRNGDIHLALWVYQQHAPVARRVEVHQLLHTENTLEAAVTVATSGPFVMMRWFVEIHNVMAYSLLELAGAYGQDEIIKYLCKRYDSQTQEFRNACGKVLSHVAKKGKIDIIKFMHDMGCKMDDFSITNAAIGGHLEVLDWAHANGMKIPRYVQEYAIKNDSREVLKWLHDHNLMYSGAVPVAANGGNVDLADWLYSLGYRFDPWAINRAIKDGRIEVIEWLLGKGATWPANACILATQHGLNTLTWILEHGAIWEPSVYEMAKRTGRVSIVEFIISTGLEH
jgi:hypothetical protein